jgi:photosystem II stability/assembly factor-like uncharacterized protein
VDSDSTGTKLIAGENGHGYVYTSTDGGVTWSDNSGSSGQRWWYTVASSTDASVLYAADNNYGYMYKSIDGGVTWTEITEAGQNYWQSIAISSDGRCRSPRTF